MVDSSEQAWGLSSPTNYVGATLGTLMTNKHNFNPESSGDWRLTSNCDKTAEPQKPATAQVDLLQCRVYQVWRNQQ